MTLTKTSFKGAFWLGSLRVIIKSFSFIKLIFIARILSPHDLGLFGIAMLPYGLLEVATESGINQALIQTKKNPKKYLSSAWLAFSIRGVIISTSLFFLAPIISRYYSENLTLAIRIVALTPLLKGLVNPAIILFRKNLYFKKQFLYQSIASITESLSTIFLTFQLKNMLALPIGIVIGGLTALILSFLIIKLPKAKLSFSKIKELYSYGKWVTVGTFMSYLNDQGDDFIVSKVLGAYPLGLYQTAYKISNLPTTQGAGLVYQIIFPIFSSIQTNKVRLRRGLIKSLIITFIISLLFALAVLLFAPAVISLLLGQSWLPMIKALNILLIFGVTRPLISVGSALFDAVGQPQVPAGVNLIKLITLAILVIPLTLSYGIIGTSWAVVIAQLTVYPWFVVKLTRFFK